MQEGALDGPAPAVEPGQRGRIGRTLGHGAQQVQFALAVARVRVELDADAPQLDALASIKSGRELHPLLAHDVVGLIAAHGFCIASSGVQRK